MRTPKPLVAALLAFGLVGSTSALDAPHDGSFASGTCDACHKLHTSVGGTLTGQAENNLVCHNCHNASPGANNQLGLPWDPDLEQAAPGTGGQHHRWDGTAVFGTHGASLPSNPEMLKRLQSGVLQCAACHDPHADVPAYAPNSRHVSRAIGAATTKTGGSGTGTMTIQSVGSGATPAGYRVKITGLGYISISHDWGKAAPTWYGPMPYSLDTAVPLDDPSVVILLSGSVADGDYWDFYVGYPRLRQTNVADAMCIQCHSSRVMTHAVVGAETTNGVTLLSHPVGAGETLGSNGGGYDLTPATMLDATGVAQASGNGDGNATNNLVLYGGTTVTCTTCHAPHNADSNSLTTDLR